MKAIIKSLRSEIKKLSAEQKADKNDTRRQIRELTWKPGTEAIVAALRSERGENGFKKHGKKALKPYRRPETGPERCSLHMYLNNATSDRIRMKLVVYGMLRGLPYRTIERETAHPLSPYILFNYDLKPLFPEGECPYTQADIKAWLDGSRQSLREGK